MVDLWQKKDTLPSSILIPPKRNPSLVLDSVKLSKGSFMFGKFAGILLNVKFSRIEHSEWYFKDPQEWGDSAKMQNI
jgi:hypothetical protein